MLVGLCELFIYLPDCHSLKDKRSIIKSLKNSIRKKYNISIAEIGHKNAWRKSIVGVGCIGDNRQMIDRTIDRMIKDIEYYPEVQLINFQMSIS